MFFSYLGYTLILISLTQIITFSFQNNDNNNINAKTTVKNDQPDIYYIITDGYSRKDVLLNEFNYDNSEFLSTLSDLDFFVAECSQANYSWTYLSVTSSLNFNYLNSRKDAYHDAFNDTPLWGILEDAGYKTMVLDNNYSRTRIIKPDIYLKNYVKTNNIFAIMNEFEIEWIKTTGFLILTDALGSYSESITTNFKNTANERHYQITIDQFNNLNTISKNYNEKKFILSHFLLPHNPYVFSIDGNYIEEEVDEKLGYVNNIMFINKKLIESINIILSDSDTPPIIIIQSDHGWPATDSSARIPNLVALYIPNNIDIGLYKTITPVNIFRLIFNSFFNGDYEILDDISYFSKGQNYELYDAEIIDNNCIEK